jgi:hypothetical protein
MPIKFEPEEKKHAQAPFFEDVNEADGYRGQGTEKSIDKLMSEVTSAVSNLGGYMVNVQRGKFIDEEGRERFGFVFVFTLAGPGGRGTVMAEIKVAAFPLRKWTANKEERAKKMVLYILRDWLESMFNFQKATPTPVATLIPFMLDNTGETLSDAWISGRITPGLLLPGNSKIPDSGLEDVVEGDAEDVK